MLAIKQLEEPSESKRLDVTKDVGTSQEDARRESENRTIYTHGAVWIERGESEGP